MTVKLWRAAIPLFAAVTLTLSAGQSQGTGNSVWLIPIETDITPATAEFVVSRVRQANWEQPLAVVFLIDTNGGQVAAMQRIVDTILTRAELPTIAVVEKAFSAGALIAMSAEQLAMLPGASIGAALPIVATPIGANPVGEKFNSAVRGQFRSVAEARGRNARIAEGMVDQRIEVPGLSTSEELITLTSSQAVEHSIADIEARTLRDALNALGYGGVSVVRLEPNLTERVGTALANPILAAILIAIGIGGILIEIFTPGFGIPGAAGILALVLLGMGAFVATPAGPIDLILILAGILLIALEVLVIPGFGVAGILGIAAIVVAVFRIFQSNAVIVVSLSAVFGATLLALAFWLLPNIRIGRVLMLNTRLTHETDDPKKARLVGEKSHLLGQFGVALSDLRPAGIARFDGERVDVITEGDFISAGSEIEVLRVEGNRVTVRAA